MKRVIMRSVVIKSLVAVMSIILVSSCGGDTIGTKAAKEYCKCKSELEKISNPNGGISFSTDNLATLGCLMEFMKKYDKYFDYEEKNPTNNINLKENFRFKNPQHQKDFEIAAKECLKNE